MPSRKDWISFLFFLVLFWCLIWLVTGSFFPTVFSAEIPSPLAEVRQTVQNLKKIVSDPKLKEPKNENERRSRIRQEILSRMDLEEMAKRSLGKHWKSQTAEERTEYVKAFSAYIESLYRKMVFESVEFIESADIRFLKERIDGEFAEIDIVISSSPSNISLIFKLHLVGGHWKAYDVVIEGISQVLNLRSQFYRVIDGDSFEELLKRLRAKK